MVEICFGMCNSLYYMVLSSLTCSSCACLHKTYTLLFLFIFYHGNGKKAQDSFYFLDDLEAIDLCWIEEI